MSIKNIVVAGGGTLGSQIAYQTAFSGKKVILYDINKEAIEAAKIRTNRWGEAYKIDISATNEAILEAHQNLTYTTELVQAVKNADLVIEAIPESIEIKKNFYTGLAPLLDEHTIITTNTSTLLPSQFMEFTGRQDKFLALHFANLIWKKNTAEIMPTSETSQEVVEKIKVFAKEIGMVPIYLKKEVPGYLLNSLLVPWVRAALELWGDDTAEPADIDKTWMIAASVEQGPFAIMDMIGIRTVYAVSVEGNKLTKNPAMEKAIQKLEKMIESGDVGIESNQGFYKYPQ